jgi:hypothetical protein
MRRLGHYLNSDPGLISSLVVFIIAALALGALLNQWTPPY